MEMATYVLIIQLGCLFFTKNSSYFKVILEIYLDFFAPVKKESGLFLLRFITI